MFLILLFLFALFIGLRLGSFQRGENFNAVAMIEIILVLVVSSICFCYIIELQKKQQKNEETVRETEVPLRIMLQELDVKHAQQISVLMHERFIIGRNLQITHIAFPEDFTISAQHCKLIYEDGAMYLEDLHSKNGTYLNGIRIIGKIEIHQGDILAIGKESFLVQWDFEQTKN